MQVFLGDVAPSALALFLKMILSRHQFKSVLEDGSLIFFVFQTMHSPSDRRCSFDGAEETWGAPALKGLVWVAGALWHGKVLKFPFSAASLMQIRTKYILPVFTNLAPFMTTVKPFESSAVQYLSWFAFYLKLKPAFPKEVWFDKTSASNTTYNTVTIS